MNLPADLLKRIRTRASNPATIHDYAKWLAVKPTLLPSATLDEIANAEEAMKLKLPEVLKELLLNVANGGFGPGYGLIGVGGGYTDFGSGNLENIYRLAHSEGIKNRFVVEGDGIVPFCNWGCGIYSCLDCGSFGGSKVLFYNPKIDFFSSQNLKSVEVRDAAGEVKTRMNLGGPDPKPKPQTVQLIQHRDSLLDFMTAWANGEGLWDEIMRLSELPSPS